MSTESSAATAAPDDRTSEDVPTPPDEVQPGASTAGQPEPAERSALSRGWALIRVPVVLFAKVYALLFVVSWLSIELLSRHPSYTKPPAVFRGTNFLEGWFRWDGNWYQLIVENGYFFTPGKQSSVAFFPAYPLTIKAVNVVVHDTVLSAILLSLLCGLTAVVLFYRWVARRASPATARLSVFVLVIYPYAWYLFGAAYADAFFIAAAIGAFVLLDRDHPVLAGVLGIVATAARPVGVGVAIGLIAVMLEQRRAVVIPAFDRVRSDGWRAWRRPEDAAAAESDGGRTFLGVGLRIRRLRWRDLGVFLSPLGLGAWMFYLWRGWGNPLLFAETESAPGWDQSAGPETWFKLPWIENLKTLPKWVHDTIWPLDVRHYDPWTQTLYTVGITFQAILVVTAIALVPRVLRKVGWGYALYVLGVVSIPLLGSKDFQGTGRYMLAAFPCFFVAAAWFQERDRIRKVWLSFSGLLLVVLTSLFARGYYVA